MSIAAAARERQHQCDQIWPFSTIKIWPFTPIKIGQSLFFVEVGCSCQALKNLLILAQSGNKFAKSGYTGQHPRNGDRVRAEPGANQFC